jgi:hypothetical protein
MPNLRWLIAVLFSHVKPCGDQNDIQSLKSYGDWKSFTWQSKFIFRWWLKYFQTMLIFYLSVDWIFLVVGSMAKIKLSSIEWLKIYGKWWNLFVCDNWKLEQPKILIVQIGLTKKNALLKKMSTFNFMNDIDAFKWMLT